MVVKRVEIANFRDTAHATLDLESQQTVLIGVNGSGKTTVLDAINLALQPLILALNNYTEGNPLSSTTDRDDIFVPAGRRNGMLDP